MTSEVTVSCGQKFWMMDLVFLARNGQFSLQYQDDNTIRGSASTSAGWGDANARLPSGRWVHYVVSYDGSSVRLYLDGILVSETSHNGYLAWGDGSDHNLYLNRYSVDDDWKANAFYDDFRIFNRSLSSAEVSLLYSAGAGDLGIRPHVSGTDPFYKVPSSHTVSFIENNQSVTVPDFLQSEINATNGTILSFDTGTYSLELNVTGSPQTVRLEVPYGAVIKDGNLSSAGAFEFRRRIITSVEDDLAWFPMDDFNGSKIYDMSGRMQHGTYFGFDATSPGQGNISSSASSNTYTAAKAFDDGGNTAASRWLGAWGNQLPNVWISYDFTQPIEVTQYSIQISELEIRRKSSKGLDIAGVQ